MKRIMVVTGVVVVLMLLGTAAVVGGKMLNTETASAPAAGNRVMVIARDTGSGPVQFRISTAPAAELPDRPAESGGIFLRRQDDAIVLGTGNVSVDMEVEEGQEPVLTVRSDGPEVEVLITRDTQVYEDVTDLDEALAGASGGEVTVQQVVLAVDSADALGANMEVEVWGTRRGDRIVAETLVYRKVR